MKMRGWGQSGCRNGFAHCEPPPNRLAFSREHLPASDAAVPAGRREIGGRWLISAQRAVTFAMRLAKQTPRSLCASFSLFSLCVITDACGTPRNTTMSRTRPRLFRPRVLRAAEAQAVRPSKSSSTPAISGTLSAIITPPLWLPFSTLGGAASCPLACPARVVGEQH